MKKWIKASIVLAVVLSLFLTAFLIRKTVLDRKEQIARYYTLQNYAFCITGRYIFDHGDNDSAVYQPYEKVMYETQLYAWLLIYERETGNHLTLSDIEEYLSQQYEEDGSLRLYINHENICGYVNFMREMWDKSMEQANAWYDDGEHLKPREERRPMYSWEDRGLIIIQDRLMSAYHDLPDEFADYYFSQLPLPVIDELVKRVYDPDYEMQLDGLLI